jgi:very-short-patch-repair endonuclease
MPTRNLRGHSAKWIKQRAKELRKAQTPAEQILWEALRNYKLKGYKFKRQQPIATFIVDFVCPKHKLIIELDGEIHENLEQSAYDEGRSLELEALGYQVIRFKNEAVLNGLDDVLNRILANL